MGIINRIVRRIIKRPERKTETTKPPSSPKKEQYYTPAPTPDPRPYTPVDEGKQYSPLPESDKSPDFGSNVPSSPNYRGGGGSSGGGSSGGSSGGGSSIEKFKEITGTQTSPIQQTITQKQLRERTLSDINNSKPPETTGKYYQYVDEDRYRKGVYTSDGKFYPTTNPDFIPQGGYTELERYNKQVAEYNKRIFDAAAESKSIIPISTKPKSKGDIYVAGIPRDYKESLKTTPPQTDWEKTYKETLELLPGEVEQITKKIIPYKDPELVPIQEKRFLPGGTGRYDPETKQYQEVTVDDPLQLIPLPTAKTEIPQFAKTATSIGQYFIPGYGTALIAGGAAVGTKNIYEGIRQDDPKKITGGLLQLAPAATLGVASIAKLLLRTETKLLPKQKPVLQETQFVGKPIKVGDKTLTPVSTRATVEVPAQLAERTTTWRRLLGRPSEQIIVVKPKKYFVTGEFLVKGKKAIGIIARAKVGSPSATFFLGTAQTGKALSKEMTAVDKFVLSSLLKRTGQRTISQEKLAQLYSARSVTLPLFRANIKTKTIFPIKREPQFGYSIISKPAPTDAGIVKRVSSELTLGFPLKDVQASQYFFAGKQGKSMFGVARGQVDFGKGLSLNIPQKQKSLFIDLGKKPKTKITKAIQTQAVSTIPKQRIPTKVTKPTTIKVPEVKTSPIETIQVDTQKTISIVTPIKKVKTETTQGESIIQKPKDTTKTKVDIISKEIEKIDEISKSRTGQGSRTSITTKERLDEIEKTLTDQKIDTSSISAQKQRMDLREKLLQASIMKPPRVPPTKIPRTRVPDIDLFKKPERKRLVDKVRQAFDVVVFKEGKEQIIARGLPEGLAKQRGAKEVLSTLRASFKLKPRGTTLVEDVPFELPKTFRLSRKDKGRFVQKLTTRFGSKKETGEAQFFRKQKMKKIKWF